jgi:carbon storage regulator CsrA
MQRGRTQIRLGIKAPQHVIIHRKEVYDQLKLEREGRHEY